MSLALTQSNTIILDRGATYSSWLALLPLERHDCLDIDDDGRALLVLSLESADAGRTSFMSCLFILYDEPTGTYGRVCAMWLAGRALNVCLISPCFRAMDCCNKQGKLPFSSAAREVVNDNPTMML